MSTETTMQALMYTEARTLEVCEVPAPRPAAGEVLLRVAAAGICGSDVHGVASQSPRRSPPLIMGHEFTGEVVGVGAGVAEDLVGQSAAVKPQMPCGACLTCRSGRENACQRRSFVGGSRPGGFGEFVAVPARCLHLLPEGVDHTSASMAEPLATCVHAAALLGRSTPGSVVVFGAGTIGVLVAQMLRLIGTAWIAIVDIDADRLQAAAPVVDVAIRPEDLDDAVAGQAIEATVDAAGTSSTRHASVRVLEPGGVAVWLGMHDQDSAVPAFDMVVLEQRVQGAFAYTDPEFARAVRMLVSGQLVPAVSTAVYPLDQSAAAFSELVAGRTNGVLKTIVSPNGAV